ncbi:MAG: response regulator [Candidatus Omnitrophica bacterium]|nr:response regulator [Candidatus Omnitrophota bacterium]MCM8798555.1 response regulator [Candidatus Omnitrophota bacterium]
MTKKRILIVDDEPDVRDVLRIVLEAEGYEIIEAGDGEEGLEKVSKRPPDLIILDFMMPKLNGPEVCQEIKKDILLRYIPIIMLTGRGEISDKIKGIDAGADDYIVKPFEPTELVARVKMVLRRTEIDLDANPLTHLPGNVSIQNELENRIRDNRLFAVCYIDLDKFKVFNDRYGFERGDKAIQETARVLIKAVEVRGSKDDFIGHIGGDDFVVITTPDKVDTLCPYIIKEFDKMIPALYDTEDRLRGYILGKDRKGNPLHTPLMTISIAVVTNEKRKLSHVAEIAQIGAELKEYAKSLEGSNYVKERRGN